MWEDRLKVDEYRKFFNMLQIVSFTNNMDYEEFNDAEASLLKQGSFLQHQMEKTILLFQLLEKMNLTTMLTTLWGNRQWQNKRNFNW
ncbi:Uncharacterised protein (plasmid) [Mesomycoplasma conjunctivae]|nr:Uncharacterised protein [Mesomycoplasma conjunctivae]